MKRHRALSLVVLLIFLSTPSFFILADAGPLNTFAASPIPYCDYDSYRIVTSWNSADQTVTVSQETTWLYKKKITITGSSGAGTNYQIPLTVTYDADMQADFDDLRFWDDTEIIELDYWIETYTASTEATVWVEIQDNLDSNQEIWMYYGNAAVSTTSNGANTFLMYEDWTDESVDAATWDIIDANGAVTYSAVDANHGKVAKFDANAGATYRITSDYDACAPIAVMFRSNIEEAGVGNTARQGSGWDGAFGFSLINTVAAGEQLYVYDDDGNQDSQAMTTAYFDTWITFQITRNGTDTHLYADTVLIESASFDPDAVSTNPVTSIKVTDSEDDLYSDWVCARKFITTEPAFSVYGAEEEVLGNLDIGIPILEQDTQEIELFMNTTDLDSEVTLRFYDGATTGDVYCKVNSSYIAFPGESLLDQTAVEVDNLLRINLAVDNEREEGFITIMNEEKYIYDSYYDYSIYTGCDWLRMTDPSFNGSFTLFYLSGDTNYTTFWDTPEWESSGTEDTDLTSYSMFSMHVENDGALDIDHDMTYTTSFAYLAYLRTQWEGIRTFETIGATVYLSMNITIDVDDIQTYFGIYYDYNGGGGKSDVNATCTVTNTSSSTELVRISGQQANSPEDDYWLAKTMFWRTQEDHIGIMLWGDNDGTAMFTGGYSTSLPDHISGDTNESLWISPDPLDDWTEANITIGLKAEFAVASDEVFLMYSFPYFEYEYYSPSGVVQPHFSTTWWDSDGVVWRVGPEFDDPNGGILATWDSWEEIPVNTTDTPVWRPWYYTMFDYLADIVTNFNQGITLGFSGLFDSITLGIEGLGAAMGVSLEQLVRWFNGPATLANAFSSTISGILSFMLTIVNLIVAFFNLLAIIGTYIGMGLTWANTYIFTTQMAYIVAGVLFLLPIMAINGIDIMGRGTGLEGATAWILTYANLLKSILSAAWTVTTGVLNIIGNFLPFT